MKAFKYLLISLMFLPQFAISSPVEEILGKIPVQDGGRYKPFHTFARESLQLVYGRRDYKGKSATEIVFTWLLLPDHWDTMEFVKIERKDLKESLKLDATKSHFSPQEILASERVMLLFQDLESKRKAQEKLNPYWQSVQTLESQISTYKGIVAGTLIRIVPPKEGESWVVLKDVGPELKEKFEVMTKAFVTAIDKGEVADLKTAVGEFKALAKAENPSLYPTDAKMDLEYHFNVFHPFMWSWILYLLAALLLAVALVSSKALFYKSAIVASVLGFIIHTYGFYLRVALTDRPPVSNMYETVVWVSWGAILFAFILEKIQSRKFVLLSANIVSVICLIVADIAPNVLDPTLQPLQPVLRSNMWLIVHVLTITISYSAFFLAFILGDIGLTYYLRGEERFKDEIQAIGLATYRSMQIGVVLLFAGTVLGGVWADYSWGRFWGWDPKETWAFIALMGYIAILHGRIAGWLKTFGFIASSIVSFSLIIMAWYGVNFVLGAGLHSYGFGAGGVEYVSAFVAVHFVYVGFVATVRQARLKSKVN